MKSPSPALTDRFMLFALPLRARICANASSRLTGVPGTTVDWLDRRDSGRKGTRLVTGYPLVSSSNSVFCSTDIREFCEVRFRAVDGEGVYWTREVA